MVWPIFGALALATGTILERFVLMKKNITIKFYQSAQFLAIILVMLPLIPFFWGIESDFLNLKNLGIYLLVIILSVLANMFTFFSMKWEKLERLESAKITEPLFVILLAFGLSFIFGETLYGRNPNVLIPAIVAAAALIFSHIKKHHLKFSKYYLAALIGSFFFAAELVASRLILDYFHPITFYFVRCSGVLLLSLLLFRPKLKVNIKPKTSFTILGISIIWVIYRVIVYFGYTNLGVTETTLTIMLGPALVYLFAWKFLKEKLTWKNIVAVIVIVASIAYATFA